MLIKAPIGSGKSFLFFDGPIYGLYKYSARNILNTKSKDGFIKVIFEVNQENYLIIRNIKKGKSKDSCESKLYKLEWDISFLDQEVPLQNDKDIEILLKQHSNIQRDEISFKNETDLQQTLQTILPPREVIMNTIFLMQDSDNIFELTPVDRLTILKNVFNLMGIDEAKDILADKKREIRYKIKATTDISRYDEKLKTNIQNYISTYDDTKNLLNTAIDTKIYDQFFDEWKMIQDKIQISDFSIKDFPAGREQQLHDYIENKKSQEQKITHQLETMQKDITQWQEKYKELQATEKDLTISISSLQKKIESIDEKQIETLKLQKQTIIAQQATAEQKIPRTNIRTYIQQHWSEIVFEQESDITVANSYLFVQELIHNGKKWAEEIKNIQLQIQNEQLKIKNEAEKIATQKKHFEEKIQDQKSQKENIEKNIKELENNIDEQASFACEKINAQCPFIKIINKKTFDQLEVQKKSFQLQQEQIQKTIEKLQAELQTINMPQPKQEDGKEALEKQQKKAEETIENIKTFLNEIDYKSIESLYIQHTDQDKQAKELDKKINELEQESKQIETRKLEIQKAITQQESTRKQLIEYTKLIADKQQEQKILAWEKEKIDTKNTIHLEENHATMKQIYHDIDMLVNEFNNHQVERQKLEEQEKILGNLYTIFSKELLLLVLQDHLPVLNDIINNYLSQIVDYQISLRLDKSNADKVELEAKIIDEKWERDTKSLSWGQKIILKLIRMLAISSYINSPILFLDETINNLDAETVGKVADMLEDFVKQREMKFYTITHSQQIQEMDIRDQTIEISN